MIRAHMHNSTLGISISANRHFVPDAAFTFSKRMHEVTVVIVVNCTTQGIFIWPVIIDIYVNTIIYFG